MPITFYLALIDAVAALAFFGIGLLAAFNPHSLSASAPARLVAAVGIFGTGICVVTFLFDIAVLTPRFHSPLTFVGIVQIVGAAKGFCVGALGTLLVLKQLRPT